ncbi:MAG: hypothetical protein U5K43_05035 [Halofilum sp. (in: g-proteobacteria)]|nr:hypothetical protein [Halofilum sp. (in: g-proteobacteria)]
MTSAVVPLAQIGMAVLAVLLVLAFVVGLAVAIRPPLLERLRGPADRRYSMRRATRAFDIPRNVDRWFYRHHRLYGAFVVVLAVLLLGFLTFGTAPEAWQRAFGPQYREVAAILVDTARVVLWALGLFVLAVGVVVFVRPSALKRFEAWANRWVTPRRATRGLEREYHGAEAWLLRHARAWGVAVAVTTAVCLVALFLHADAIARLGG